MNESEEFHDFDDLDWRAFQFVTEGLSDAEREAFEQTLFASQAAREAVARAVELTWAAAVANRPNANEHSVGAPTPHREIASNKPASHKRRASRTVWAVVAASVVIAAAWQANMKFLFDSSSESSPIARESNPANFDSAGRDLALAWSESRVFAPREPNEASGAEVVEDASEFVDPAASEAVETPSWMLAAVAGLNGDGTASSPAADRPAASSEERAAPKTNGSGTEG